MTRGGKREKAGRPSSWASGCKFEDTKLIRVPAAIADKLLEFAHKLDAGESIESVTKTDKSVTKSKTEARQLYSSEKSFTPIEGIACPSCDSTLLSGNGFRNGKRRYRCRNCGRQFMEHIAAKTLDSVTNLS